MLAVVIVIRLGAAKRCHYHLAIADNLIKVECGIGCHRVVDHTPRCNNLLVTLVAIGTGRQSHNNGRADAQGKQANTVAYYMFICS